jgi:serine O-acetyltransferase
MARTHHRPRWLDQLARDVDRVIECDPAARNRWEVALLYSGVHALWAHRVSHRLWQRHAYFAARALSQAARSRTGIEIHPAAQIGDGLFIDHGAGVVIGETAQIGRDVTIYQGVTLGGTGLSGGKRHPTIADRVTIGAGAKVLGDIEVGEDAKIGANAVLVRSVDSNSVVVGVPGQVISSDRHRQARPRTKEQNTPQSDPIGSTVQSLLHRVERLETLATGHSEPSALHMSTDGYWQTPDYSI